MSPTIVTVTNGIMHRQSGKYIEFSNGEFTTGDQAEIDFLKARPYYGIDIWEEKTSSEVKKEAVEEIARIANVEVPTFGVDKPTEPFKCAKCGFVAKSKLGLTAHQRKCNAV